MNAQGGMISSRLTAAGRHDVSFVQATHITTTFARSLVFLLFHAWAGFSFLFFFCHGDTFFYWQFLSCGGLIDGMAGWVS